MTKLFQRFTMPIYPDKRGHLIEVFNADTLEHLGLSGFPHALAVVSNPNILRGMHYQLPPQGKYITVTGGAATLFGLDLREGDNFGKMEALPVNAALEGTDTFWLPPGCAFGYYTHTNVSLLYFLSQPRSKQEYAINFFDASWNRWWNLMTRSRLDFIVSEKDTDAPTLEEYRYNKLLPLNPATLVPPVPTTTDGH